LKRTFLATALSFGMMAAAIPASVLAQEDGSKIKHVLLISVDGLHALDVARYGRLHPHSALAELAGHGITYSNANTPANSDSFPGLLALVTGGSPISHGLFYDVSYDRNIFAPGPAKCSGNPGNTMVYDESIDVYNAQNVSQDKINQDALPWVLDENGNCVLQFPHNAMRSNTIFEVVKSSGGTTAWADKHPAYDLVNGPSGTGVDDLYTPEITNVGGLDATGSVVCTVINDYKKVAGIINEIHGLRHDGTPGTGVPTVFGMNFQAVSVGQKLVIDNLDGTCVQDVDPTLNQKHGGYLNGDGTPTHVLDYGLQKTDEALGMMIAALKAEHIYDSTLVVITAKHGQSPINPAKVNKPGHFADLVAKLPDASTNPAAIAIATANGCSSGPCGFINDDDIAVIWLAPGDQSKTSDVARYLNKHAKFLFIDEVLAGDELQLRFKDPEHDSRTPDIIVRPTYGTTYTAATKNKNAEHGGVGYSDTNVGLVVSNPALHQRVVKTPVASSQVAPSILKALGIDPDGLDAVRKEQTQVLPFLFEH
jgi:hypothetical protein